MTVTPVSRKKRSKSRSHKLIRGEGFATAELAQLDPVGLACDLASRHRDGLLEVFKTATQPASGPHSWWEGCDKLELRAPDLAAWDRDGIAFSFARLRSRGDGRFWHLNSAAFSVTRDELAGLVEALDHGTPFELRPRRPVVSFAAGQPL